MSEPFDFAKLATAHNMYFSNGNRAGPAAWFVPIKALLMQINIPGTYRSCLAIVPNESSCLASSYSCFQTALATYTTEDAEAAFVAYCLFNGG